MKNHFLNWLTADTGRKDFEITQRLGRTFEDLFTDIESELGRIAAQDLGDIYPRKVVYDPFTGKVQVKKLRTMHNDTIVERETGYMKVLQEGTVSGDIELFS